MTGIYGQRANNLKFLVNFPSNWRFGCVQSVEQGTRSTFLVGRRRRLGVKRARGKQNEVFFAEVEESGLATDIWSLSLKA